MALPLCLDRLVNVGVALVLSTTAIVLFGEILPQVSAYFAATSVLR
jgi:CBS domain containing-hemolysin-like protein